MLVYQTATHRINLRILYPLLRVMCTVLILYLLGRREHFIMILQKQLLEAVYF